MERSARTKKIINFLITCLIVCLVLSIVYAGSGCRRDKTQVVGTSTESLQEEAAGTSEDSPETSAPEQLDDTDSSSSTSAVENATESTEETPEEITELIETADDYYSDKEYGLAKNAYRKAEIAIDESELSDGKKEELKDSFYPKYEKSQKIIETARMHFTNAKQLEYEQRYEQALAELEAAITIYPKYEEALEAYENLKALMGLQ